MAYSDINGYMTDKQSNYGFGLSFMASGKAPIISHRIWDTYEHLMAWINDATKTAIVGLIVTVNADTDTAKNGVYRITKIGDGTNEGAVEKLGASSSAESVKEQVDNLTAAVGASSVADLQTKLASDELLSGSTSVLNALTKLEDALKALDVTDTAVAGQYVSEVDQTDGKIAVTRANLPVSGVSDSAETDKVVTAIKLEGNVVKATHAQLGAGSVSTTAVGGDDTHVALAGATVSAQLNELSQAVKSAEKASASAIEALDYSDTGATANTMVTAVTETNGVISVSHATVPVQGVTDAGVANQVVTAITLDGQTVKANRAQLGAESISATAIASSATQVAVAGTDVKTQIGNLATAIKTVETASKSAVEALDYTDTAVAGEYVSEVDQTDGKIAVTRATIPVQGVSDTGVAKQVVTAITLDGQTVKASRKQLSASDISTTAIASSDTQVAIAGTDASTQISNIATAIKTVETASKSAVEALDYTDTAVAGQYVSEVDQTDGKIAVTRANLPVSGLTDSAVANQVVTEVKLENGVVKASHAQLGAESISATAIASSATQVAVAGTDVKTQIGNLATAIKTVETASKNAVDALDYTDTAVAGQYVSEVDQTDGKIAVTRANLPVSGLTDSAVTDQVVTAVKLENGVVKATHAQLGASSISATAIASSATQVAVAGDDVAEQIGSLATAVKSVQDTAATYSVKKVTTGLDANVKEAYQLVKTQNGTSTDVEVQIPIYKDSSLKSAELVDEKPAETEGGTATKGQYLKLTYNTATGTENVVYVDMSKLVAESEFKNGLQVNTAGEVSVKKDTASEDFLSVSASGVKISGVQTAIDNASASAKTVVDEDSDFLSVSADTTATDGHTKYVISTSNIAKADELSALSGKSITSASATGITTGSTTNADGTKNLTLVANGGTIKVNTAILSGENETFIATGKTMDEALQSVVDEIIANEKVEAEALIAIKNGVGLNDDGSYTPSASDKYITNATDVADALDKLDAAINTVSGNASTVLDNLDYADANAAESKYVWKVTETNGQIAVSHKDLTASAVSATAIAASETDGTVAVTGTTVEQQIQSISKTLYDDLTIDCGTY